MTMTQDNFIEIYKRYLELRADGKEAEADAFLQEAVEQLSPEGRAQIMTELATMALEEEVREHDTIADMQEDTIGMYNELEEMKRALGTKEDSPI